MYEREIECRDLALEIGRSTQTVKRWVVDCKNPKVSDLACICEALDVSADYLLGLKKEQR